jgi:uncharacterized protein DUF4157
MANEASSQQEARKSDRDRSSRSSGSEQLDSDVESTQDLAGVPTALLSSGTAAGTRAALSRQMTPSNILALQRAVGNQAVQRLIQRKLQTTAPGDAEEVEADAVADRVMTMPDPVRETGSPLVHRQETVGTGDPQPTPEDEAGRRRDDGALQGVERESAASESDSTSGDDFSGRLAASEGGGSPLPSETREYMEPRFGEGLGDVRVHTGTDAAAMSTSVQAQAFTYGSDIYFGEGKYDPSSSAGKQLLAHELTHTIQQRGGSAPRGQSKPEAVPAELGASAGAPSVAAARSGGPGVSVSAAGPARIARIKEAATGFGGAAGTADVRAAEAGTQAGGFSPISVSTDYTLQQAERKVQQMDSFRNADIPFVYDNQEHYAYKKLAELRQEYVDDVSRIGLAQGAFNDFVVPGTLANKSTAQFRRLQFELGFTDESDPAEDLSPRERKALAKKLDERKIRELNSKVSSTQQTVQGLRKEILGTAHNLHAAAAKRAGILAAEAKSAAEDEKKKIDDKIAAVKSAAETAGAVVEAVSFAGFGAPGAIAKIGEGGASALEGGLELGSKGTSAVGAVAEFIMTEVYKQDIQKAKQKIELARAAGEAATRLDAEFSSTGFTLQLEGQVDQLSGAMEALATALKARKSYFEELAAETERATGQRPGGNVSQFLALVSQANETKSQIETAKSSASSGLGVMNSQISAMASHRGYAYVADSAGVWDDRARKVDAEGPDLGLLKAARNGLQGFNGSADKLLEVVDRVVRSLPAAE